MRILLMNMSPKNYGATPEILKTMQEAAPKGASTELVCLGDWEIGYCKGCKACYQTRACVIKDGMEPLLHKLGQADVLVLAAPSYWADVPGVCKSIEHWCGHMGAAYAEGLYFCQIDDTKDIGPHKALLREKAAAWFQPEREGEA